VQPLQCDSDIDIELDPSISAIDGGAATITFGLFKPKGIEVAVKQIRGTLSSAVLIPQSLTASIGPSLKRRFFAKSIF
jgi:hypothetical protein